MQHGKRLSLYTCLFLLFVLIETVFFLFAGDKDISDCCDNIRSVLAATSCLLFDTRLSPDITNDFGPESHKYLFGCTLAGDV